MKTHGKLGFQGLECMTYVTPEPLCSREGTSVTQKKIVDQQIKKYQENCLWNATLILLTVFPNALLTLSSPYKKVGWR